MILFEMCCGATDACVCVAGNEESRERQPRALIGSGESGASEERGCVSGRSGQSRSMVIGWLERQRRKVWSREKGEGLGESYVFMRAERRS